MYAHKPVKFLKIVAVGLSFAVALACPLFADGFAVSARCVVAYGDSEATLGALVDGDESWSPLFFAVLPDGTVAIPDYYKNRIVLFSGDGAYKKSIPVGGDVLSPRINYFGATGNGRFAIFGDSALYCFDSAGTALWNAPFPMGVFPGAVYAGSDSVWLSVPGGTGYEGIAISAGGEPYASSTATVTVGGTSVPYVAEGDWRFGYSPADTALVFAEGKRRFDSASLPAQSRLLAWSASGVSVWAARDDGTIRLYALDGAGKPLAVTAIDATGDSSWYWAVGRVEGSLVSVYVFEPSPDAMTIVRYDAKSAGREKDFHSSLIALPSRRVVICRFVAIKT